MTEGEETEFEIGFKIGYEEGWEQSMQDAEAEMRAARCLEGAALLAALPKRCAPERDANDILSGTRWRHKVRGTVYDVLGEATLQTGKPLPDDDAVVVYRDIVTGSLWARPTSEFTDGRFEEVRRD